MGFGFGNLKKKQAALKDWQHKRQAAQGKEYVRKAKLEKQRTGYEKARAERAKHQQQGRKGSFFGGAAANFQANSGSFFGSSLGGQQPAQKKKPVRRKKPRYRYERVRY